MRQIMIMAGAVIGMAVAAAHMADQAGRNARAPSATAAAAAVGRPPPQLVNTGSSVLVRPDMQGRFMVDARVNGRHLQFLIDTGATMVALKARDAALLGIHPGARDFTVQVSTANGSTRAAPAYLAMVEVDNLNVRNVTALVSPDEALSENLLGMSFLSRVHFTYNGGMMVLEQ
ncbi:MAG TPA: TIGR02281 family clan AA aspartic protease [Xanthobacteraceae bacterium]|nr:TIGR02281 family clan AA aspartic protease [Xanthobacteraceae bacterium]